MSTTERPSWDDYFLGIAEAVAIRGDCLRSRVGAVLVRPDRRIAATGYNGSPPGGPSCLDGGCVRCSSDAPSGTDYGSCIETHAEANCLLYADWADCQGSTLYITRAPCRDCTKLIKSAGVHRIVWSEAQGHNSPSQEHTSVRVKCKKIASLVPGTWRLAGGRLSGRKLRRCA